MYLTYLGSGERTGRLSVEIVGYTFPLNVPVYVPDDDVRFAKIRNNNRFKCEPDSAHGGPGESFGPAASAAAIPKPDEPAPTKIPTPPHFQTPSPGAGAPSKGDGARHVGTLPPKPGTPAPGLPGDPAKK